MAATTSIVRLPGLVDVHVHLREPGGEYKETWETGTAAALAGGITTVLAMPNTNPSIVDKEALELVAQVARKGARCDYGIYLGANQSNSSHLRELVFAEGTSPEEQKNEKEMGLWSGGACSLKMYLNETFSTLKLSSIDSWMSHFRDWPHRLPIVCHAEGQTMAAVLSLAQLYERHVHIAHVSLKSELELIRMAKAKGINVTCEVCPHHLFLCREDFETKEGDGEEYGSLGKMEVRPRLASREDRDALWANMDIIDIIATDHAPHTVQEKNRSEPPPPPGFPGLETVVPLMLTAVVDGRLTLSQLIEKMHTNPHRIFSLTPQDDTYVEVEMGEEWVIPDAMPYSKAAWTPFAGLTVKAKIKKVVLRGAVVCENGIVLAEPGSGLNVRSQAHGTERPASYLGVSQRQGPGLGQGHHRLGQAPAQKGPAAPKGLRLRNLVSIRQLSRPLLDHLFSVADDLKSMVRCVGRVTLLEGCVLACLFYEPSTRTSCSFQVAMQRMGGNVITVNESTSSVQKGESLSDTVRTLASYCDILVIRHPSAGSADEAAKCVPIPVINAGDGTGEHPTQALLDSYTILNELGTLHDLHVVMVGDLKHGRTVHSLVQLLAYYNVSLTLVSPPSLRMPAYLVQLLRDEGIEVSESEDLEAEIPTADVLYVTRIQKERFSSHEEYLSLKDSFIVTPQLMKKAKKKMAVLHPLPRVNEIHVDVDNDPRAAYFRQMEAGMYVRMAILAVLLGKA